MVSQAFGQMMLNDILPAEFQSAGPMNKKDLYARLYQLARKDPKQAADVMEKLRKFGHEISTSEGVSITLDDITPDYQAKKGIVRPALERIKKMDNIQDRQKLLDQTQTSLNDASKNFQGSQGVLVRSGAKGNAVQVMKSFISPVSARTETGDHYPWFIHHSFAEGIRKILRKGFTFGTQV